MPRTAKDAVADLHALLEAAAVPGPYVLVGHSTGGLIIRLYASTDPKDVAGLVLVDAIPEGVQTAMTQEERDALRSPPAHWSRRQRSPITRTSRRSTSTWELRADEACDPPLPTAADRDLERPSLRAADLPAGLPAAVEKAWLAGQQELAGLLPDTPHIIAAKSSHYVPIEQPQLVIDAIKQVEIRAQALAQ